MERRRVLHSITDDPRKTWAQVYEQLLGAELYDTSCPPERSFLYRAFHQGVRQNTPVFVTHELMYAEGQPVGLAVVAPLEGHGDYLNLYVRPSHRGQGIGQALLARVQQLHPAGLMGYRTPSVQGLYDRSGIALGTLEQVQEILWAMGETRPRRKPKV